MSKRYITEFAYNNYVHYAVMTTPAYLKDIQHLSDHELINKLKSCNIYLICSRPKLYIDPTVQFDSDHLKINFQYKIKGNTHPKQLVIPRKRYPGIESADEFSFSEYPHDIFSLSKNGQTHNLATEIALQPLIYHESNFEDLKRMKVLYVGMSHSESGNKYTILDRVLHHSKIQLILSEYRNKNPDDEIFVYFYKYRPYQLHLIFNPKTPDHCTESEDHKHITLVENNPLRDKEVTAINEAALIQYFKPQYNDTLKNSFPSTDLKLLRNIYKLDFCNVTVEIDSDHVHANFYSDSANASEHHIASFNLSADEIRNKFFGFRSK